MTRLTRNRGESLNIQFRSYTPRALQENWKTTWHLECTDSNAQERLNHLLSELKRLFKEGLRTKYDFRITKSDGISESVIFETHYPEHKYNVKNLPETLYYDEDEEK